ncbi:hypothetical protein ACLBXO_05045 [Methylobacterium sp. C33D]|uniref:hypothetical protein n=1 Tax=Methylobacterium mesophilicum TaxID=39956 RepID=UPI002F2FFCC6
MIPTVQADALLGRLAEALGSPVEIFFAEFGPAGRGASPDRDALPTLELFRLWETLREPVSWQRVLAAARQEARQEARREARQEARTPRTIRAEDAAAG